VGTIESTKAKSMISLSFNMNVLHETIRKQEQTKKEKT
jgi:hypothetical protein